MPIATNSGTTAGTVSAELGVQVGYDGCVSKQGNIVRERAKITDWIQAIGLILGLAFAGWQLFLAVGALEQTAIANTHAVEANRPAMVAEANGLLTQVNLVALDLAGLDDTALDTPLATGYSPRQRLHLLRLQYCDRMHRLNEAGFLDAATWAAELQYVSWLAGRDGFRDMWTRGAENPGGALREQYRLSFRTLFDDALSQE